MNHLGRSSSHILVSGFLLVILFGFDKLWREIKQDKELDKFLEDYYD